MARSSFLDFLDGYESDKKHGIKSSGSKRFFSRSYSGSITGSGGAMLKRTANIGNRLTRGLSFTSSNSYGAALLAYGSITFIAYFLIDYFSIPVENGGYSAILGVVAIVAAIPFLFSDKPMAIVLQRNRLADFLLFEFFCIKRPYLFEQAKPVPMPVFIIIGTVLGGLGFFVPSWIVAVSIVGVIILFLAFLSPECTFLISLMALPYIGLIPYSEIVFSALILLTVISFIRKVACGKRVVFFEQYELLLILMMLAFLVSGIFMKGADSFLSSLLMITMSFGYVLSGNLITNRRLAECSLNALVISSIPAAAYSVYCLVSDWVASGFTDIHFGFSSTFSSTAECAIFMLVSIVMAAALGKQVSGIQSVLYGAVAVLDLLSLIASGEAFAVLALVLGALAYSVFKLKWLSAPLILLLASVPYAILLIPGELYQQIAEYFPGFDSAAELKQLWAASISIFWQNIMLGVGVGEESFAEEMAGHGLSGFTDSKNTFIELGLEAGIFALVFLVLIFLVRIRHRANYRPFLGQSEMGALAPYTTSAIFALVCYGATEYIWSEDPSFYLFWVVFGVGSAILRVAKKEVDDRTLYYEDTRDVDYSAIDINLR